jgi:hypothetical protein
MEERKLVEKVRGFKQHGPGTRLGSPCPSCLMPRYVTMQYNAKSCALACTLRCGRKDDDRDRGHTSRATSHRSCKVAWEKWHGDRSGREREGGRIRGAPERGYGGRTSCEGVVQVQEVPAIRLDDLTDYNSRPSFSTPWYSLDSYLSTMK